MSNQTAIPIIQTPNDALNQVQQNTNKIFRNLSTKIDVLQSSINDLTILGEIKLAGISLTQFQHIAGTNWIAANGQSAVNTDYSRLTGNNSVPTISVPNANAFIKVNNV